MAETYKAIVRRVTTHCSKPPIADAYNIGTTGCGKLACERLAVGEAAKKCNEVDKISVSKCPHAVTFAIIDRGWLLIARQGITSISINK